MLYWSKISRFDVSWDLAPKKIEATIHIGGDYYTKRYTIHPERLMYQSFLKHNDGLEEPINAHGKLCDASELFEALANNTLSPLDLFMFLQQYG